MEWLNPRERFQRIMAHQPADRVPLDLAGTSLTRIVPVVFEGIKTKLGIDGDAPDPSQPCDERVLTALNIDFRRVGSLIASGDVLIPGRPAYQVDMWGVVRAWTCRQEPSGSW